MSAWHLLRRSDHQVFHKTARVALIVLVPAALLVMLVGSELGVSGETYQPMKIAAGEALWNSSQPARHPVPDRRLHRLRPEPSFAIKVPHLLSVLATNSWNGKVLGMNQVNAQQQKKYGAGDYIPQLLRLFLVDPRHGLPRRPRLFALAVGPVAPASQEA